MSLTPVPAPSFRVALVYPTIKENVGGCTPPIALLGLATVLRDAGIAVRLFDIDAFWGDRAALVRAVVAYDPSLLGFPVFHNTYDDVAATLQDLRKAGVSCPVVLGRPEVTASAEAVHAELSHVRDLGTRNIMFQDDLFVSNLKRVKTVLDPVDPGWGMRFKVRARVDTIDDDICMYLVSKGVTGVTVGFESGSDRLLELMGKRTTVADNYRAMEVMRRHGLKVFADMFFMYPGENMESAKETMDFIFRSQPAYVNWGMFIPLPGTPITLELQEKGLLKGRYGVGQRPRITYDYLTDSQRTELHDYIFSNMKRYNGSLRHVVLPNLADIVTTAGPRQYRILGNLYWKRYGPQLTGGLRAGSRKA
jgi:hypothetical protein